MTKCDECGKRPSQKEDSKDINDLCPFNKMADGRAFTDYTSRCQKITNMTSYDERMFLMKNAKAIMDTSASRFICSRCMDKKENSQSTMLPEKYKQVCNKNNCKIVLKNEEGVGLGR